MWLLLLLWLLLSRLHVTGIRCLQASPAQNYTFLPYCRCYFECRCDTSYWNHTSIRQIVMISLVRAQKHCIDITKTIGVTNVTHQSHITVKRHSLTMQMQPPTYQFDEAKKNLLTFADIFQFTSNVTHKITKITPLFGCAMQWWKSGQHEHNTSKTSEKKRPYENNIRKVCN